MKKQKRPEGVLVMEVFLSDSNDDLVEKMRAMRQARTDPFYTNVVCGISGWADDPRELWEVVEVRAFCRRLVALGFVAYLDRATWLGTLMPDDWRSKVLLAGLGAAEVWLIAEGLMRKSVGASLSSFGTYAGFGRKLDAVLEAADGTACAALGPIPE